MATRRAIIASTEAESYQPVVIWLDNHIDDQNEDCRNTIQQLEHITTSINTFTDNDECVEFILNCDYSKVCLILSGSLGQRIVPCIHEILQLHSIFIFGANKQHYEQWAKDWVKIKGVYTDIISVCKAVEDTCRHYDQNIMPMSFVPVGRKRDQLDPSFMYTQLLKERLLAIDFEDKHIAEFINDYPDLLRIDKKPIDDVEQLVHEYHATTPIYWYSRGNALHSMLNHGLRTMDRDMIVRMGFFIKDLHQQIEKLHKTQFIDTCDSNVFTVYRGQGLSKVDFEQLTEAKGGLMSFNNFLSTSKQRDSASAWGESSADDPDLVGILFKIQVNPDQSTAPFARIFEFGQFSSEDEVLFSMHTIFRILDIKCINHHRAFYEVNLSLTNDSDKELCTLADHIRLESSSSRNGWADLSCILVRLNDNAKAEQIYTTLLNETSNDIDKAAIYSQLATIKRHQGTYPEAIEYDEKALLIRQQSLSVNHHDLAISHNNIGLTYYSMGDYRKTLQHLEKALSIDQQSLSPQHPALATSYSNIASLYARMGDYRRACIY